MEQHPIPQQISSYQIKLVGDMTLKQFFQVKAAMIGSKNTVIIGHDDYGNLQFSTRGVLQKEREILDKSYELFVQ